MADQFAIVSERQKFKKTPVGDIPVDWEIKSLGELGECVAGATPSTSVPEYWHGKIRWMNSGELNLKRVREVAGRITEEGLKNSSTKLLPPNCVLIGLAGQGKTRGTAAMNLIELCTNQSIAAILPNASFVPEYLYYNLDSRYSELRGLSGGESGRGGLNLATIRSILIPLPSLREQKKIAEILIALDNVIDSLEREGRSAKSLERDSVASLFRTGLKKWRCEPLNKLLSEPIRNGYSPISPSEPTGLWTLELGALSFEGFRPKRAKPAPANDPKAKLFLLERGDLLVSRSNTRELVGLASIYDGAPENCIYPDLMMRLRPSPARLDTEFLEKYLLSPIGRVYFQTHARGTSGSMVKINSQILGEMRVPVPSIREQREFVQLMNAYRFRSDMVTRSRELYLRLRDGLRKKLMNGQLRVS